jgi:hypothetical protein
MKQLEEVVLSIPVDRVTLEGTDAERYLRFARAAARLRSTGDEYQRAQDEYKSALGLFSASAEKLAGV